MSLAPPILDIPAAIAHLGRVPGPMPALIAQHGAPPLRRTRDSFKSLGRAIIYQQLSGKAADTIYSRLVALYPHGRFPRPHELLATPPARLHSAGISRSKAAYLHDLAQKFSDGTLVARSFGRMDDAALASALTRVKGIGPWSVDMFLLFGLLRPDVLPVGDLGVRKGMQMYFALSDLPAPARMHELAAPWQPYRSVASWYMWRLVEGGMPAAAPDARPPARSRARRNAASK